MIKLKKAENVLPAPLAIDKDIQKALKNALYVGIDFGTSNTVVSYLSYNPQNRLIAQPFALAQPTIEGEPAVLELVNSVLAYRPPKLLFGREAYNLRTDLFEGKNCFSSFKMRLGLDEGPSYPETVLSKAAKGPYVIETATDATREFFIGLYASIKSAVKKLGLPEKIYFAVSVPASFEANQRRDLLTAINEAGFPVDESCLIDEPNAAFLSYFFATYIDPQDNDLTHLLTTKKKANILIYDFGAGTCDVSILEIKFDQKKSFFTSRNMAISRFTALGGDDLDRAISQEILIPQLLRSNPEYQPLGRHIAEKLVPRLMPVAERLKVIAMEYLTLRNLTTLKDIRLHEPVTFATQGIKPFKINSNCLSLPNPKLTLEELGRIHQEFVVKKTTKYQPLHVFGPIDDALMKAQISPDQLDFLIFIGGSSHNPLVRQAILSELPSNIEVIIPADLQRHVSIGASYHSLYYHALKIDMIKPITPETIFVITKDEKLKELIPASTPVPTEKEYLTRLKVPEDRQAMIELPICVGSAAKLLGVLQIPAPTFQGFPEKAEVEVTAAITQEKSLKIDVEVLGLKIPTVFLNPLANRPLTEVEQTFLAAKKLYNIALLESGGRPPVATLLNYAHAAIKAKDYQTAVDTLITACRLDPKLDKATDIAYCYAQLGNVKRTNDWTARAYDQKKNYLTAYNLAVDKDGQEKITLLRESLSYNSDFTYALYDLGMELYINDNPEHQIHLNKFTQLVKEDIKYGRKVNQRLLECLKKIGKLFHNEKLISLAEGELLKSRGTSPGSSPKKAPYKEKNLTIAKNAPKNKIND
ncbi:MAG: Hsp70 family protein [Deltaproteobacteria bacterium]|jgi:molecular chaperone DnaK (HSP70)|nr:Hsp70 family protein [Deltaproteobacteria bacterium]